MKKFAKGCLITGGVLALLGILTSTVALAAGGREQVREMVQKGELDYRIGNHTVTVLHDGAIFAVRGEDGNDLTFLGDCGILYGGDSYEDWDEDWDEDSYDERATDHVWEADGDCEVDYGGSYGGDYDEGYDTSDEFDRMQSFHGASGIFTSDALAVGKDLRRLKLKAGCGNVEFRKSADGNFYIENKEVDDKYLSKVLITAYEKEGTLYLKRTYAGNSTAWEKENSKLGTMTVFVPKDFFFENFEVQVGVCTLDLEEVLAAKVKIESGVSDVKVERLEADQLEIENGVGVMNIRNAVVSDKLNIENALGTVDINLTGEEEDYATEIESALGNVRVGTHNYTSLGQSTSLYSDSTRRLVVECGLGSVDITFQEPKIS